MKSSKEKRFIIFYTVKKHQDVRKCSQEKIFIVLNRDKTQEARECSQEKKISECYTVNYLKDIKLR